MYKLAIHSGEAWNSKWRNYCDVNNIEYLMVNCYDSNIVSILLENKVTHLMWHFHHGIPRDILTARNILYSCEKIGIKVFPEFNISWHFDDKISQKYLLEALKAKMVPTHVYYSKEDALNAIKEFEFPLVAKLRRGAGSYNVKLIRNKGECISYINRMFGKGYNPSPRFLTDIKNKVQVSRKKQDFKSRLKKVPNYLKRVIEGRKMFPNEKGYVYFQKFIKNNDSDIRVAVVGDYIWAFKRYVRSGDFRASGSGMIEYNFDLPIEVIKYLHELSLRIGGSSIAYDLVIEEGQYLIVEISYGYSGDAIYDCKGYWNDKYEFVEEKLYPEHIILKNFIKS